MITVSFQDTESHFFQYINNEQVEFVFNNLIQKINTYVFIAYVNDLYK